MTLIFENELENDAESLGELSLLPLEEIAGRVITQALDEAGCPFEAQVSLLITDDDSIREMNGRYRGIDQPTDVLSFPMLDFLQAGDFSFLEEEGDITDCFDPESGELLLGDIVISAQHACAQAASYGHSVEREYAFLITHSVLHLCGYDHMDEEQEKEMFSLQNRILEKLGILR